ncbi:MAG: tetratricopeptide repeat protein [Verrucomicrobiales bacterium]|nr:tetratricopeptide repeat protein [Verrucomicrobiales bacterium]
MLGGFLDKTSGQKSGRMVLLACGAKFLWQFFSLRQVNLKLMEHLMHAEQKKVLFSGGRSLLSAVAFLLCGVFCWSGALSSVEAQQIDPSDLWYRAFVLMKEGEAKEREQKALAAYNKFVESKRMFDAVAREHPDFHPSIVRYRRKELGDKLLTLKTFLRNGGASSGGMPAAGGGNGSGGGVVTGQVTPSATKPAGSASPPAGQSQGLPSWNPEFSNLPPTSNTPPRPNAVVRPNQLPETSVPQPTAGAGASPFTDATRQIKRQFEQMEAKIRQMEQQNQSLNQAVIERESRLKKMQEQVTEAQKREQALVLRFRQLQQSKGKDKNAEAQIVLLKKELSKALDTLEAANKQNREILSELQRTREEMVLLRKERDDLEMERSRLAEIIENGGDGPKAVERLTKINAKLRQDLSDARLYAESLAKSNGDKQIEVEVLKEKVAEIAEQRLELLEENEKHQLLIADLQQRLQQTAKGVVEMSAGDSQEALEENRLLRGVVLRQLRRQAQIKQAREMVLEQLAELGVESEVLLESLDAMSVTPGLTEEEKKLFKQPAVADLIQGMGNPRVDGAIIVEGGKKKGDEQSPELALQDLNEELEQLQKVGQFDFSQGRYKDAERAYRKFLSYRPKSVEGICNLATVQLQLKEYGEAEKLLKKSLTLKKADGRAYYLLGVVYFEQGKLDEALKRFDEGLQINPKNAKAHNCVGVISSQKGWVERAEKAFTEAITIAPDYADAHFNLSILYTTGKKPDRKKGEKHYRKAVELGLPRDAKIEEVLNS